MKAFRIRFSYQGILTKMPSAQSIFGAFSHGFKTVHGEEALETFFSDVIRDKTSFALSSMFLSETLPLPLDIEPARLSESDLTKDILTTVKKLKKVRFISSMLFHRYKEDKESFNNSLLVKWIGGQYVLNDKHQLLHHIDEKEHFDSIALKTHVVTRNKWGLTDDEKELFYTAGLIYSPNATFDCYVYVSDRRISELEQVLEKISLFSFGGLRSIGYNVLKYIDIKPFETHQRKGKVLLSKAMVVPSEINFDRAFYRVGIIESHYDNTVVDKRYRQPIVAFEEGSVFETDKCVIGDLVESTDTIPDYQNALGLMI